MVAGKSPQSTPSHYACLSHRAGLRRPSVEHAGDLHVHGSAATYAETVSNVEILRAKPGCSSIPVHLIGGLAENSSTSEVKQFVRGVADTGCIGGSLYGWAGTYGAEWRELAAIKGGRGR